MPSNTVTLIVQLVCLSICIGAAIYTRWINHHDCK